MGPLTAEVMRAALKRLDELSPVETQLIMGGGGAMILVHGFPRGTTDIDAIPRGMSLDVLDPLIKQIAREQSLPNDWLNPYFASFSHTLPEDYGSRLISAFRGQRIEVFALGREDMLIIKCFAHRAKDVGHAKALIQAGADTDFVFSHIEKLEKKGIPLAAKAVAFLDDVRLILKGESALGLENGRNASDEKGQIKGLAHRPDAREWDQYFSFLSQPLPSPRRATDLEVLARGVDFARLDPRAAELFVARLIQDWARIPAPTFATAVQQYTTWSQALGVLLEFVQIGAKLDVLGTGGMQPAMLHALTHWCEAVIRLVGISPCEGCEQFYFGTRAFAGALSREDAALSLAPFLRWGYISQEVPFNKAGRWQGNLTLLPEQTRRLRLNEWVSQQRASGRGVPLRLTVDTYRQLLGGWVSVRQAQLDLKKSSLLRAFGQTRGRQYRVAGRRG